MPGRRQMREPDGIVRISMRTPSGMRLPHERDEESQDLQPRVFSWKIQKEPRSLDDMAVEDALQASGCQLLSDSGAERPTDTQAVQGGLHNGLEAVEDQV